MSNEWLPIVATLVLARVAALAQVVETSNGKVEFIGLEKWTPATIQEKLGYASPDKFHFCAADLKERLKFADASVTVVNVGANAQIDSKTAQQAVIGYVLTNGGLMANVSLEGTKITPISI